MSLSPAPHLPSSSNTLQLPGHQRQSLTGRPPSPGFFEMQVRTPTTPTHSQGHAFERSASATSYTTAADEFYSADDNHGVDYGYASGEQSPATPGYAFDSTPQSNPDIPNDEDRPTHDRRRQDQSSDDAAWEGGRAV